MTRDQHIAIGEAIGELCNPDAHINERIVKAELLRSAFGFPLKHTDECKIHESEEPDASECNCAYWDAVYPADMSSAQQRVAITAGNPTQMNKHCERCGKGPTGDYGILDYCAECSKDLCDDCMAKGCCGHVPALSGENADHGD